MVLESTIVCIDNSEFMRNGDFSPSRLLAQQEAVTIICHSKTRANPENNVGLITMSEAPQVLTTLTTDVGKIFAKLYQVEPSGHLKLMTAIRIAHLALKHRVGKNHKMRIVAFVGSPIADNETDLVKLAKRLKKEKVNVDIINFGEEEANTDRLTTFINTLNGKDGSGSHLVTVPPGPHLSGALISSPIVQNEDGTGNVSMNAGGFEFGIDPAEDPELALALRVSMEEQRLRQEEELRQNQGSGETSESKNDTNDDQSMLAKTLAASEPQSMSEAPDFATMSEEEQIAYAMQMSLQHAHDTKNDEKVEPMETDEENKEK